MVRLAAVEGGGQSWVAVIAQDSPDNIILRADFITEEPEQTLTKINAWLKEQVFDSIGIATFGPVDANPKSPTYGFITSTPKPNWGNTDVLTGLGIREFGVPFKFDTDVNAPALAEYLHLKVAYPSLTSCAYITVGTGIGVGLVVNNETVHGLMHPEAGHISVAKLPGDDFPGCCPFHGTCVEGLCATGAIAARKGCDASFLPQVPDDDDVWEKCAYYLASLCSTIILVTSVQKIVLGGGVMNRATLYSKIRKHVQSGLNGYISISKITDANEIDEYITPSVWGARAGIVGALHLAVLALTGVQT